MNMFSIFAYFQKHEINIALYSVLLYADGYCLIVIGLNKNPIHISSVVDV